MKIISMLTLAVLSLSICTGLVSAQSKAKGKKTAEKYVTTKTGLKYCDVVVGKGAVAKTGETIKVHYTGTLTSGKKFDSSKDRGVPFEFTLGGRVIAGWNEGVKGMKIGGTRKLIIPANLGYGSQDMGEIPPNSTLLFTIDLLEIVKK
ncbi:MAG: FKBP-type peptidyl-prolyl cis-trans isomerase [Chthonomonadales bacterium]